MPARLTRAQARRVTVAAQGLAAGRPAAPTMRHLTAVVDRVGMLQMDSVNVLVRAHYMPLFSRLGAYDRALLDRAAGRPPRRLVEYWAHEACLLPPETLPHLRWRMRKWKEMAWGSMVRISQRLDVVEAVLDEVARRGPMTSKEVERALAHDAPRRKDHWGWNWSVVKQACEHLFWAGRLTSAGRTTQFERRYAVPERVWPAPVVAAMTARTPTDDESYDALVRIAARAYGVSTDVDLRDYWRLPPDASRAAVRRLVGTGELVPVEVEGMRRAAYLHAGTRVPRRVTARALLAPFDPLVWERSRVEALFGFRYRIGIYTPKEQRVHGYYVLPFLLDDALVARVDLKADRAAGVLRVQAAFAEPDAPKETAEELADELRLMAGWLELDDVAVSDRGDLAVALAKATSR